MDYPGPDPDHRGRPVGARHRQRVCHVDDDQRPPRGADHRSQSHRAVVVRGRAAVHDAVGGRRRGGHRVHRRHRTARCPAALRAGHHRRVRRRHPRLERAHRRAAGATARPGQRPAVRLHRARRDGTHQQPGRKPGGLVLPVRGVGVDADADPARRAAALRADLGAGGRRDHRIDEDSRAGHSRGPRNADVRRLREPLAGPADPSEGEHRLCRRRACRVDHVDMGGHGARRSRLSTAAARKRRRRSPSRPSPISRSPHSRRAPTRRWR